MIKNSTSDNLLSRRFFVAFLIVTIALIIDLYLGTVANIVKEHAVSIWGLSLFGALVLAYLFGSYLILGMAKKKIKTSMIKPSHIVKFEKALTVVQYVLAALVVITLLQIYITSQYHTDLITSVVTISYGFAALAFGLLAYRLLSYFNLSKTPVVLLYGLAAATMTINAVTSAILFDILLLEKQDVFSEQSGVEFDFECKDGDLMCFILPFQSYTLMAYFLLLWGGSVLLLRHNIRRVGKLKFWILVSVPLVTFYFMFIYTYDTLYTINEESDVEENIPFMIHVFLIITAGTSCGILYGIGFRSVSRLVSDSSDIKDYMMIAAYGIVIYFVAGNATVAAAGYPPFGLVSVSFVGLSAFLVLQGIYNSAVSVAHDVDLRRSIKKSALKESKLLDSMGKAEIQHELEKKVMKITKDKAGVITQESEVQPSLSEDELKKYFDEVISEVRKEREK